MRIRTFQGSMLERPSARVPPQRSRAASETYDSVRREIPFIRPSFPGPAELAEDFRRIAYTNWYTNFGPKERQFAHALGEYLGADLHVATLANGTMALIAALHVTFGAGSRDRYVLMPSFTFVGVAQAALWTGYRPWFIDIDAQTWQPCAESARAVLKRSRDRIAGIVLANVFGVGNPQIAAWEELAAEWGLPIVIDSAAGFGSTYADGERVGGRGNCEIFSLHATKPFAVGEGGALVSRYPSLVEQTYRFQNFGFGSSREAGHFGTNAKLQEINAAIGLRQLIGLDDRLESRRAVLRSYRTGLADVGIQFQQNAEASSLCFASACCTSTDHKSAVLANLNENAIQARDYYNPPQHRHPYFIDNDDVLKSTDLSVTEDICSRMVSLPVHDYMAYDDVARVIAAAQEAWR
ncbi:MAG: DegT/DnrJ/EryC1/StrS family aminotransferase [Mycobacteriaceae bacterium]|nr:DegT/DnrJ/EryC1/StrS family aminotransferase [Mycobacteriaceae bacterium]